MMPGMGMMPMGMGMGGMMGGMGMMSPMLLLGRPPAERIGLPRGNAMCRDQNTACPNWAKAGHCSKGVYYKYMSDNCCASCRAVMAADKTGPDGGTAPKIVAPATGAGTGTATGTAPGAGTGTAPGAGTGTAPKPIDLAAINAAAVAKAKADAEKKKAVEAQTAEIKKLVEAAAKAAKQATEAAEKIAAAEALAKLGNQGAQGKPDPNTKDVKNTGNTAGPDKTPIDPQVLQQLINAFKQSGGN